MSAIKKRFLLCLFVGMADCLYSQVSEPHGEALSVNKIGNIVALRDCDSQELASFLNTSPQIAVQMLEKNTIDSTKTLILKEGDSIGIDYGQYLIPEEMTWIGKIISAHLDNQLDKYLFSHYWNGNGDVELTETQFAGILLCIKQQKIPLRRNSNSSTASKGMIPLMASFYNTPYEKAFGHATIYVDSCNHIIGFSDIYDFDKKRWGIRPVKYELYVRIVSLLSPSCSFSFKIYYDGTISHKYTNTFSKIQKCDD